MPQDASKLECSLVEAEHCVKPVFHSGKHAKVPPEFEVFLAGWIDRQVSMHPVERALKGLSGDEQYSIAHNAIVRRAMINLHIRLADAASAKETPTKEPEPHYVDVPWTFAKPDAIEGSQLFFVISERPCFCNFSFKATGDGPVDSVSLHWTIIGPPDCTANLALLMVNSLCDCTEDVCQSVRDGVDSKTLRLYETYTIACPSGSIKAAQEGSHAYCSDSSGEVLSMCWHCHPNDYTNIGIDDMLRLDWKRWDPPYLVAAAHTELACWQGVQLILTRNLEAAFRLEELVAKNLGMRDIRGKIERTIKMIQTEVNIFSPGFPTDG